MKLYRAIVIIGGWTIGSRIFGFVRTSLTASYLGTGTAADAFNIAIKLPSMLRRLFAEGAFSTAFVPIFSGKIATHGKKEALKIAENIFNILLLSLVSLTVLAEVFMEDLIAVLVPGFSEKAFITTVMLTRITFPCIIFMSFFAFYGGILNSYDRFTAFSSSSTMGNLCFIIFVMMMIASQTSFSHGTVFALAVLVCGMIQFLWVYVPTRMEGVRFSLKKPTLSPDVKRFFKVLMPTAIGSGIVQINIFIGSMIGSYLSVGGVSILTYADRINQLPLSVIGTAIGTALLPLLSRHIRKKEKDKINKCFEETLEILLLLTLPATLGLICCGASLVHVCFVHGAFTLKDGVITTQTLQIFAIGLPAYILIKLFSTLFFANNNPKTPLYGGIFSLTIDVFLSLLFLGYGPQGISLAMMISAWLNAIFLVYVAVQQKIIILPKHFWSFFSRLCITCFFHAGVALMLDHIAHPWVYCGGFVAIMTMTLVLILGVVSFFSMAHLMEVIHLRALLNKITNT